MDGGFQRMVSNARWASGGAVDGAGLAQPLSAEYPIVARSKVGASAANLSAVVRTLRLSTGHPRGQRRSVWIDWPGGAFAFEHLVDGVGNLGGVHCSRPSRTERWARANASSDEGRNHSAALAQSARAATPDDRWVRVYNQVRPHEALGQQTPAEVYRPQAQRRR